MHPLIDRLEACLGDVVPAEPIVVEGAWSTATRRTYERESQAGGGTGPFVDVIDARWKGTVGCTSPIAGIAFLYDASSLHWVKSAPASTFQPVSVSFHAYAEYSAGKATFGTAFGGAFLPGVAVSCGPDFVNGCAIGIGRAVTGRAHVIAEVDGTAFVVLLIQGALLKTGRNHLWRLRQDLASSLPADVSGLLTRRRTGVVRTGRTNGG